MNPQELDTWLGFVPPPHSSCTKHLTTTCAPGAGRFVLGLALRRALMAADLPLKHPTISKGLSFAAFPVLFHFQDSQNASVSQWQGMLEMPGHFPWELGRTWSSGLAPSLPVALLASSLVYLHHLTDGSLSWMGFLSQIVGRNCPSGPLPAWAARHQPLPA